MTERFADVGDIRLCYETFGDSSDPALLLIMGLGTQMIAWHEDFCSQLAERGFYVIRFDNRDIGRSSKVDGHLPTLGQIVMRSRSAATYTLRDMADDAAGLLDALGIEQAHVVGASMGGMIAQVLAIGHPERVLSLASIMSNTGNRFAGQPALGVYRLFLRRQVAKSREEFVDRMTELFKVVGSRERLRDEAAMREMLGRSYDRDHDPRGSARQLGAIVSGRDRTQALRRLDVPAVVIHGTVDRLVLPSGGRATAKAIPGARLVMIEDMGHDLPRGAWPQIVDAIAQNAARASSSSSASALSGSTP